MFIRNGKHRKNIRMFRINKRLFFIVALAPVSFVCFKSTDMPRARTCNVKVCKEFHF